MGQSSHNLSNNHIRFIAESLQVTVCIVDFIENVFDFFQCPFGLEPEPTAIFCLEVRISSKIENAIQFFNVITDVYTHM